MSEKAAESSDSNNYIVKNPYIRAQTSGQLTASDPIRTTHENIAIYCGELPVFRKKTKGQ